MAPASGAKPEVEDSASSAPTAANKSKPSESKDSKPKGKNPKSGKDKGDPTRIGANSNARNPPPSGFSEGNKILEAYGLSVSGRKERILSLVKTDKYFHLVEDCWKQLVDAKPDIVNRYSYNEFRHASALMLYQRIEAVKFEALGIKPSAATRIPLPRNLRVFQPIWSVLSNIGIVDDDDLRALYIPDAALPKSKDLDTDEDVENLISCTLYDWPSSWEGVRRAREDRVPYDERIGYYATEDTNEAPPSKAELIKAIKQKRQSIATATELVARGERRIINGSLYKIPVDENGLPNTDITDEELVRSTKDRYKTPDDLAAELEILMAQAKASKEVRIRPRHDVKYTIEAYRLADGTVNADPGAYGAWLQWDPQLWLEYEQMVEILNPVCLFSLSMPVDTSGTYMWLLPTESRNNQADIFCKMPKASIPPVTWILALMLQMSTLPNERRCTWYVETDSLSNLLGLRQRYIRGAIKRAAPTEQYGTY